MFAHQVAPRVEALLKEVPAEDEVGRVRAALAMSLATKLDSAIADDSATSAMATPAISKELRATLEELVSAQGDKEQFIADLFK
jgi:hypothetical protein